MDLVANCGHGLAQLDTACCENANRPAAPDEGTAPDPGVIPMQIVNALPAISMGL